ncbi:cytochrome c3 family protein [Spirulina major]|uniref:cytochrome c3 family protein n=1 Tax=Spirulina major TaxID=270636 RepID=UPI000933ED09
MISWLKQHFSIQSFLKTRTAIILLIVGFVIWFGAAFAMDQKQIFLPGQTSEGHHLFEASCSSCHEGFKPVSNDNCNRCHEAELAADVHGVKKFRDPRWAVLLEDIDVLTCTACHNEHVQMFGRGVHLHPDLCMACHEGIIQGDLASHDGFTPDGCWTAGCHNFHDHRSISTAFLTQNLDQPFMLPTPEVPELEVEVTLDRAPTPDLDREFLGGGA